ncbi:MAG: hypothetical protein ABIQ95_13870 [Bdellovibrionia bacterium]
MVKQTPGKQPKRPGKKPLSPQVPFAVFKNAEPKSSKLVRETLLECIRIGDVDSFREALASHIVNSNKLRLAKKTGLGRQTLYDLLDPKRTFNPALSTVAAIFRRLAE